jgi:hypothetical protein
MATVPWIKQSQGLANKIDPARIQYSPKLGISNFAEAYNVDFDITGAVSRRKGFTATTITTASHSFFDAGEYCLFVTENNLCTLGMDYSTNVIRITLTPGKYMSYCQLANMVLYMNGVQSGVVKEGVSYTYEMPSDPRYPDKTREYSNPPIGSIIRSFSGRVYIADGSTLWYSEPFAPSLFRKATNYIPFPARIVMVAPVLDGIFISTTRKIYFLAGKDAKKFEQIIVAHYPVIEGTDVEVDGIALNAGKISPLPLQMFTTTNGICAGAAGGKLENLTYEVLDYPKALRGCAVYTGKKYIVCLEA